MRRNGWHMHRDGDVVTLARRLPVKFDILAESVFPDLRAGVLAHEIRKDLWRRFQGLRGFSPVVEVTLRDAQAWVRAGGRVEGALPSDLETRVSALLAEPHLRARWIAHARKTTTSSARIGAMA